MSLSNNFPTIDPSLMLDFANTQSLDPRITFTRTTTATYYDGKTTAKAEENLLLQSEDFTTSWVNFNSTDTANTEVAPDGTTTADTITDNATSGAHFVRQSPTIQINTPYVFSCFLKAGTSDYAYLGIQDSTTTQRYFTADFDLSNGTVRTSAAGTSGTLTSSSITLVGNGWYRCVIVGQVAAMATANAFVGVSDGTTAINTSGAVAYVGTGSDIYAWGAQLEQRSAVTAYTPTTTQPITNYIPVLLTAPAGVARFDHNPTTGESLGLLVEEQRTNLFTYSDDFADAAWTKTRSSITANTTVAPDGTLTGDKLVEDTTASNTHLCQQAVSFTSGTSYTMTVYAKAGERPAITLITGSVATALAGVRFNLTTGVAALATGTIVSFSMTSVGNGWYRCQITQAATATTSDSWQIRLDTGSTTLYTGDGYSGIYIWGAQLEEGAFPTSYIATTSATVTRNADAVSMTGTNFSSWYRADEGMLYLQAIGSMPSTLSGNRAFVALSDGTYSNVIQIVKGSGAAEFRNEIYSGGGAAQAAIVLGGYVINQQAKVALGYKVNDVNAALNGTLGTTDTSATIPTTVNKLELRDPTGASGGQPTGWIQRIAFYPSRLSDAQLQALTS